MNIMIVAVIGDLSSGKETIAKFYESKGFKLLQNEFPNNKVGEKKEGVFSMEGLKSGINESLSKERSSLKEKLRKACEEKIVIYPYLDYEDYLDLRNKTSFRLINLISPAEKRYNNFLKKYSGGSIENFFALDNKITSQINFCELRSKAFCHLENKGTLEDLEESFNKMFLNINLHLRPTWDDYFMSVAHILADRSNCIKQKVGAVIVKDKRIISTGYNGTPSKIKNCFLGGCPRCNDLTFTQGQGLDSCFCLHAEENAVLEVGRMACQNATLYSTVFPCLLCAKIIIECGISKVYFSKDYNSSLTHEIFAQANMTICKWSPEFEKFY